MKEETFLLIETPEFEVWKVKIEKPMKMSLRESVAWQKGWDKGYSAGKTEEKK